MEHWTLAAWHNPNFFRHYHMGTWGKDRARPHPSASPPSSSMHVSYKLRHYWQINAADWVMRISFSSRKLLPPDHPRDAETAAAPSSPFLSRPRPPNPGAGKGGLLTNNPGSKSHTETGVPGTGQRDGMSFPPAPLHVTVTCHVELSMKRERAHNAPLLMPGTRGNVILSFSIAKVDSFHWEQDFHHASRGFCRPRVCLGSVRRLSVGSYL
ncbi:hypothetical protein BDP55DRAFT_194535 [Colletotrichum godetiae]|uniref:Uncharacterized protein n=1 Tax=Colletotrichum godetiae TaxID=1209918 RepID=A0AAJ0AK77_9PEZI|nr:uncharacterized protein BDP55DRAFT_194535 [Colletotrichum godetiae]KAK1673948.1 hypothetical protein BDP55DRAFT_194535 [Colletotrichum godetiae]